ncbi:MAG: class I adenylate-forming enzyme family protein [Pseudomonadales bacterium]
MQTSPARKIREFTERGWWGKTATFELFAGLVARHPDRVALVDPPNREDITDGSAQTLTFSQLAKRVDELAAQLYTNGIRQGDIAVVQMPNISDLVALYLALAKLGAVISPVPMQYGVHELRKIGAATQAKAYISVQRLKDAEFLQNTKQAFSGECLLAAFGSEELAGVVKLSTRDISEEQLDACSRYANNLSISANDILTLCWTSGTTGSPKAVPRSHNHWFAQGLATGDGMQIKEGEAMLNPFPLVNMASFGGFFFPWLQHGGKLVLHHPMDLNVYLGQLQDEEIAYTIAAPAMLTMLLKQKEILEGLDLSRLRVIASGSAPLSPWMVKEYQENIGIDVVNVFGSNEGVALISGRDDVADPEKRAAYFPRFGDSRFQWANRAAQRMQTRLVDPVSGTVIDEPGTAGELQFAGPTIFDGYYNSPEANQEVFTEDGYFRTGDLFEIAGAGDDSHFYRFTGRCKDIIVRGGMKISPEELDTLLAGHPKLSEVAVTGYADEVLGERICAVVVPKPGETVTLEDITAYLQGEQVAVIKLPERIEVVDALPRNPLGKVVRNQLKEMLT